LEEFITEELVSVAQCAQALRTTPRTVRRLIEDQLLPGERINPNRGWYRIRLSDLEAYAAKHGIRLAPIPQKS
jgi:excisionase family DNA binding protein